MFYDGDDYRPSMTSFLNKFCKKMREGNGPELSSVQEILDRFFAASTGLNESLFRTRSGFSVLAFETVFRAASLSGLDAGLKIDAASVSRLREDDQYRGFTEAKTNDTANVKGRLARGLAIIGVA
jgi:hypothetical protein